MKFQPSSHPLRSSIPRPNAAIVRPLVTAILLVGAVCQFQGCSKPTPVNDVPAATPAPTVMATPAATPEASPTPTPEVLRYDAAQQKEYILTAQNAFLTARSAKIEPFILAKNAFNEAGGASAKGLVSKEAIAARRALIATILATNEECLSFVKTQDEIYRQELTKTPLVPSDVESLVAEYAKSSKSASVTKLREIDRDLYKVGDDMMAFLDKTFGAWTLKNNSAMFKKPSDANAFAALAKKFNGFVEAEKPLQTDMNPPLPTAGVSPLPSVAASPNPVAPAATVAAPTTSPAAVASPAAAKAKP